MKNTWIGLVLLLVFAAVAFASGDHGDDETPSVAVTQWTEHMELFMEYPVLVSSEPGRFIPGALHTRGASFRRRDIPVRDLTPRPSAPHAHGSRHA